MTTITFVKMKKGKGSRVIGILKWGADEYEVVMGKVLFLMVVLT